MKRLVITFILLLALAVVVLPGPAAAHQITTVGPSFNIFTGHPSEFQAGAPFHGDVPVKALRRESRTLMTFTRSARLSSSVIV